MAMLRLIASDEGIQAFHPVDKPLFQQKPQGPVNRGRLGRGIEGFQGIQEVVGLGRLVGGPDQFQYPPPQRGKPDPPFNAQLFRGGKGLVDTGLMVVGSVLFGSVGERHGLDS